MLSESRGDSPYLMQKWTASKRIGCLRIASTMIEINSLEEMEKDLHTQGPSQLWGPKTILHVVLYGCRVGCLVDSQDEELSRH